MDLDPGWCGSEQRRWCHPCCRSFWVRKQFWTWVLLFSIKKQHCRLFNSDDVFSTATCSQFSVHHHCDTCWSQTVISVHVASQFWLHRRPITHTLLFVTSHFWFWYHHPIFWNHFTTAFYHPFRQHRHPCVFPTILSPAQHNHHTTLNTTITLATINFLFDSNIHHEFFQSTTNSSPQHRDPICRCHFQQ